MRTTVDIDSYLLKRLRAEAHRRGLSFKELLTTIIRRGLAEPTATSVARYRCPTYPLGSTAVALNLDKALALAAGLEDEETARDLALRK